MSVVEQEDFVAANVEVPWQANGCRAGSGKDSDMNVQATGISLDSESQVAGIASRGDSYSMSVRVEVSLCGCIYGSQCWPVILSLPRWTLRLK